MGKRVFVTVGTTEFDSLIQCIDSKAVQDALVRKGFNEIVVQIGRGAYEPRTTSTDMLRIEHFRLKSSLAADMKQADLIISHAGSAETGAGSILEGLQIRKQLIVVVNDTLMGNHQTELAEALANRGYLTFTTPSGLASAIDSWNPSGQLMPYSETSGFVEAVDKLLASR